MIKCRKGGISNMKHFRKRNTRKTIWFFVLITLIFSIGYIVARLITTGAEHQKYNDYILMLAQCTLGLVVLFLPDVLQKKFSFSIPNFLAILYYIFLYCAIYLGEVHSFYYRIPFWDDILHGFSACMLATFGFLLVELLNENENVRLNLSPVFVSLFAFCFALSIGVLWEMYEFLGDELLGLNMQKFRLEDGSQLVGHAALRDTMKDLIIDGAGSLLIAILGLVSNIKRKKVQPEEITQDEI